MVYEEVHFATLRFPAIACYAPTDGAGVDNTGSEAESVDRLPQYKREHAVEQTFILVFRSYFATIETT